MSENTPTRGSQSPRLVLAGVLLISLAIFIAWTTLKRASPLETASLGEAGSVVAAKPSFAAQNSRHATSGRARGQLIGGRRSVQRVLKYGDGEGELGMVKEKEQEPVGPESFAVGKDGGILVADVVNQRVAIYSSDGTYLRSIALAGNRARGRGGGRAGQGVCV